MSFLSSKSLQSYDMSLDQIRDWYSRAKTDHWYQTQMPVVLDRVASAAEIPVPTFHGILGEKITPRPETIEAVERAINKIENREIIWFKQNGYELQMLHLSPPKQRPRRAKLSRNEGFDIFSICATCQCNKWLPLKIDGKDHVACYSCLPPGQWPSIGALQSRRSLIRDYIRDQKYA